jgi:hypothetical protein
MRISSRLYITALVRLHQGKITALFLTEPQQSLEFAPVYHCGSPPKCGIECHKAAAREKGGRPKAVSQNRAAQYDLAHRTRRGVEELDVWATACA